MKPTFLGVVAALAAFPVLIYVWIEHLIPATLWAAFELSMLALEYRHPITAAIVAVGVFSLVRAAWAAWRDERTR